MIGEQGWEAGRMPRAGDLQAAGKHRLVAAIRLMGGFRVIAAQLGLKPAPTDRRGRPRKQTDTALGDQQQESALVEERQLAIPVGGPRQSDSEGSVSADDLVSADDFKMC